MIITADVTLTPAQLAAIWCELDDDAQAQFFIEAAHLAAKWGPLARDTQARAIGAHLRTCTCSNDETRRFVMTIAAEVGE